MATSVWKGHISFGLVAFPVKLHAAARSQAVSFNQLHQCDHSRVKQVLYCQAEDKPVSRSELVKGFEYEKDRYVVVEERELDQMAPRSSRVMEVLDSCPRRRSIRCIWTHPIMWCRSGPARNPTRFYMRPCAAPDTSASRN